MIAVNAEKAREMLAQLTDILSICQCAQDAAIVAQNQQIETVLAIANGMTLTLKADMEILLSKAKGGAKR